MPIPWNLSRQKVAAEGRLYRQQHAVLKDRYLGQYIAMHEGQVVDTDIDYQNLYQRVRSNFAGETVMITRVGETPETIITRRGFRYDTQP